MTTGMGSMDRATPRPHKHAPERYGDHGPEDYGDELAEWCPGCGRLRSDIETPDNVSGLDGEARDLIDRLMLTHGESEGGWRNRKPRCATCGTDLPCTVRRLLHNASFRAALSLDPATTEPKEPECLSPRNRCSPAIRGARR